MQDSLQEFFIQERFKYTTECPMHDRENALYIS